MTNDTALTRYLYIRLYRADKPQRDGSILFYYYRGGAWDSILDAPSQRAGMVPLCHSDWYLYGISGVINFFESTSGLRSRVFPSEKHEFESLQDLQILSHLTRWAGRGNHTLPGSWYSTPPHLISSIWLYIRPILLVGILIVDTRLYQSSCGSFINWLLSIYSMSASSASWDSFFSHVDKTPLQTCARLLQLKRPPRGLVCTSTPSYFDHWVLVIAEWHRSTCEVFWNGNYMMSTH